MKLEILPDAEAVASAAAEILIERARAGGQIALSGGATPKRAYALAAERLQDWRAATLWLGDERHVAPADERSTARMVREELLTGIPRAAAPRFEAVRTELELDAAAADYEARLAAALGEGGGLDLALMGLGPDGHTASLFEGQATLQERARLAVGVPVAGMEPQVPRVTLTLPVFDAATQVVFLVAGADKAQALERAFGEPSDPTAPAAHIRPISGRLLVLADEAAATRMSRPPK